MFVNGYHLTRLYMAELCFWLTISYRNYTQTQQRCIYYDIMSLIFWLFNSSQTEQDILFLQGLNNFLQVFWYCHIICVSQYTYYHGKYSMSTISYNIPCIRFWNAFLLTCPWSIHVVSVSMKNAMVSVNGWISTVVKICCEQQVLNWDQLA